MLVSVIALVIGSSGQDGQILVSELSQLGYKVIAASRSTMHFGSLPEAFCDLSQETLAHQFLSKFRPDLIFHVAAVHGSSETQDSIIATNRSAMYSCHVGITRNILTWLVSNSKTRFHLALSSQMYQPSLFSTPVTEMTPTNPQNFYGQTKSDAWDLLQEYRMLNDLKASASILFNHASKYTSDKFVFAEIAKQFIQVLHGESATISLRNPFSMIDVSSAVEVCNAMINNVNRFPKEDFVLASGKIIRLSEIIVSVATDLGVSNRISNLDDFLHPEVSHSPPIVLADPSKAKKLLGWQAELTPEEILVEIISNKLRENRN
jgi:GDPmannose 4,6-dehydratase